MYAPYRLILLQFEADPFKTLHARLEWSEDMYVVILESEIILSLICIYNLDFQNLRSV